jgi:predicted O-methyltransferase YrrM
MGKPKRKEREPRRISDAVSPKRAEFLRYLRDGLPNKRAVEVGVCVGAHAQQMLEELQPARLVLVDIWPTGKPNIGYPDATHEELMADWVYAAMYHRVGCKPGVEVIRGSSYEVALVQPDNEYGLVYIDANHGLSHVTMDLNIWWPKVTPGGVLCGHDWDYAGITPAVNKFAEAHNLLVLIRPDSNVTHREWAMRKPG